MSFYPECRNESEVESKLIVQYLLPKLGYSPDSWYQEVVVGSIRLDFLAFAKGNPLTLATNSQFSVVMEAKHPNQNLNNHVRRLRSYLTILNVRYGLLTNGREIRIYEQVKNELQLLLKCDVKNVENNIEEIKSILGKDKLINSEQSLLDILELKEPIYSIYQELKRIEQLFNQKFDEKNQNIMKIIAIYHNKGGVGKTTIAVNLAAALRKKDKKVLLIDIDSQANTTFATGLIKFQFEEDDDLKDANIFHVLESGDFNSIQDIARTSHYFSSPEIDVIPSHINLIEGQYKLNQIGSSKTRLVTKLKKVEEKYDIVIIDTPPSRDLYAQVALIAADYLIIPSDLKPFANQGLTSVKSFVKDVNEFRGVIGKLPLNIMGVLPSKISTNHKFLEHTFPRQRYVITERYNLPLMEAVIYERTALSEFTNQAVNVGELEVPNPKSIFDFAESKPSNPAQISAGEFELLAAEVIKNIGIN